ncbi:MAG: hypothetical protein RLY87_1715 [Chloroflexota bacterium]|jgi:hypothetical protein
MHEHRTTIERLRTFPIALHAAVAHLDAATLTATPLTGEWSIAQNVHHLADSHLNCYIRCKLIASESEPPLKPYDQDQWAAMPDATDADLSTSLAILAGVHARWAAFYADLPAESWLRGGLHPEAGRVTLASLLVSYVNHGDGHLDQIARTLAAIPHR